MTSCCFIDFSFSKFIIILVNSELVFANLVLLLINFWLFFFKIETSLLKPLFNLLFSLQIFSYVFKEGLDLSKSISFCNNKF